MVKVIMMTLQREEETIMNNRWDKKHIACIHTYMIPLYNQRIKPPRPQEKKGTVLSFFTHPPSVIRLQHPLLPPSPQQVQLSSQQISQQAFQHLTQE
jgi:hypothetical protein